MSIIAASLLGILSCSAQKVDNSTVRTLDLKRYLGSWYEIARFDHSFERGVNYATANYSLNADGTITVVNNGVKEGKDRTSIGKAKTTGQTGILKVSFFGPFYSDYRVLMLDSDYSYALVGSKSPNYLWILSRTATLPDETKEMILKEACRRGYDTDKLIWVVQAE